jgi:hypothetical protein
LVPHRCGFRQLNLHLLTPTRPFNNTVTEALIGMLQKASGNPMPAVWMIDTFRDKIPERSLFGRKDIPDILLHLVRVITKVCPLLGGRIRVWVRIDIARFEISLAYTEEVHYPTVSRVIQLVLLMCG